MKTSLVRTSQGAGFLRTQPLSERIPLCEGELFANQHAAMRCSATLVAPDLVLTAAHCLERGIWSTPLMMRGACERTAVVFGYALDDGESPEEAAAATDLEAYNCVEVVAAEYTVSETFAVEQDYALIRLDRPVEGRAPALLRVDGPPQPGERVALIGHPSGIPQKVAVGTVAESWLYEGGPERIWSDVDTFSGNSGGSLYDEEGSLVGVHASGSESKEYFWEQGSACATIAVCGESYPCEKRAEAGSIAGLVRRLPRSIRDKLEMWPAPVEDDEARPTVSILAEHPAPLEEGGSEGERFEFDFSSPASFAFFLEAPPNDVRFVMASIHGTHSLSEFSRSTVSLELVSPSGERAPLDWQLAFYDSLSPYTAAVLEGWPFTEETGGWWHLEFRASRPGVFPAAEVEVTLMH